MRQLTPTAHVVGVPHEPGTARTGVLPTDLVMERRLAPHRLGERWLARWRSGGEPMLLYKIDSGERVGLSEQVYSRIDAARALTHRHALRILASGEPAPGRFWFLSPYVGSPDGLLPVDQLLTLKPNGRFPPVEAFRAMQQVLDVLAEARHASCAHGPVVIDELLIDRRGCLVVELVGIGHALARARGAADDARQELRSVFEIGWEMVTGVPLGDRTVDLRRLAPDMSRAGRRWFERGLRDQRAFASPRDALAAIPARLH